MYERGNTMRLRRIVSLIIMISSIALLSGCDKPLFQTPIDKYEQVHIKKEEMQNDIYYIKEGTEFTSVLKADTDTTKIGTGKKKTLAFLTVNYKTVPTLYKNEIIAIASEKTSLSAISVTRFKEAGYSFGFFGLQMDSDGYLVGQLKQNLFRYSDTYSYLDEKSVSTNYRIVAINGEPVNQNMIDNAGVITCLEQNAKYEVDYYAGTKYQTDTFASNVLTLEEYEYYTLDDLSDTKNGYVSYQMPEDAKSGWYYIKDAGMFRYIAENKGTDESSVDMNEPYYTSQEAQDAAFSQKFSTTFNMRTTDVSLVFSYDTSNLDKIGRASCRERV